MKTLEMLNKIKPEQKMERVKSDYSDINGGYVSFIDGILCWEDNENCPFQIAYEHLDGDEWELIKKPITWQEGIQGWLDEKKVYYLFNGERQYLDNPFYLKNNSLGRPISKDEISFGKWYIEE